MDKRGCHTHILQLLPLAASREQPLNSRNVRNFMPALCGRYDGPTGRERTTQERGEDGAITDQESGISIRPNVCANTTPSSLLCAVCAAARLADCG